MAPSAPTDPAAPRGGVLTTPQWGRVEAVVFDLDGTLYDARRMRRRMLAELALACLGRPAELATVRLLARFRRCREELAEEEAAGIGRLQYERPARQLGVAPERVERAVRRWMLERPLEHLPACRYPGVGGLFDALRASGRRVGVHSDYPVAAKLAALGLDCDAAISALDPEVDRLKPHPAGLERLLDRLGVAPAAALVIGDRPERDGACARRAGADFLLRDFQAFDRLTASLA